MATVYPTAAGAWSTRTWNDDATGAAYGPGTPQAGDTVLANGLAITIDVDITVESLRTRPGTTAVAGGSFTTSGTRTVNADSYAGTTNCLVLTASSSSVQNGNSYGSNTTDSRIGTQVNSTCIQNGNATGGNGTFRNGSTVAVGGTLNGDSFGGTGFAAYGANVDGIQYGNATGGSANSAFGSGVAGILIGDAIGGLAGAAGAAVTGHMVGNATGGPSLNGHGVRLNQGGFFNGSATCSTTDDASGLWIAGTNAIAIVETATGNATNRFGVLSTLTTLHVVVIKNESGTHPKSLGSGADTTYDLIPFADRPLPSAIATAVWSRVGRTLTS